jgi:membrane fusion protein, multidrug efflux system
MSTSGRRALGVVLLLGLGIGAGVGADRLWQARSERAAAASKPAAAKPDSGDEDDEPAPAAVVRTVVAVAGELQRNVDAVGTAAAPPGATLVESWPTDVMITRILVQPGETVSKDTPLAQISPTRDAETQLAAAHLSLEGTTKALDVTQQRLDRGLATRTDLLTSQAAHDEAKQRLERLQGAHPPQDGLLRAHAPGTVGALRVQQGAIVTAGTPILDITSDAVVAQIGIDPADASGVAVGAVFEVRPIDDRLAVRWKGTVALMSHTVNATSRLVDATLTLSGDAQPRAGTPLRAHAALSGASGVLVPRAALVPDGDEMIVFVVRDGTAVRSPVTIAMAGREQVTLASGGGCSPGDHVVVSGQSQLTSGATVRELTPDARHVQPSGGDGADR